MAEFENWLLPKIPGYRIRNRMLFETALTHDSVDSRVGHNYQRLEFLGDAIAGLVIEKYWYFSQLFSADDRTTPDRLCSNETFGRAADRSQLTTFGYAAAKSVFSRGNRPTAELFESVTAALYLDSGSFAVARSFVESVLSTIPAFLDLRKAAADAQKNLKLMPEVEYPPALRAFGNAYFPPGEDLSTISLCLLAPVEGRTGFQIAHLYRLGKCVHEVFIRELSYSSHPKENERELKRRGNEISKQVLREASFEPLWSSLEDFMPEPKRAVDDGVVVETRTRFLALTGAMFLAGGLSWVRNKLGWVYPYPGPIVKVSA